MIPEIKKILYTTDLSKNSAYVFRYTVDFAQRHGAKIIILYVLEQPSALARIYMEEEKWEKKLIDNREQMTERIKKRLEEFCRREGDRGKPCAELVSQIIVRLGYPVDEILRTSEEESCDIIILGTHGKGFLIETFLGSVSRSVLERTRKPIFIIPLPKGITDASMEI